MNTGEIYLTQSVLKAMFDYEDGSLVWRTDEHKSSSWNTRWVGRKAGSVRDDGYLQIVLWPGAYLQTPKPKAVRVHRLIFCWHHGYYPEVVDHINGNPRDNRIENLRAATQALNQSNMKKFSTNKTGVTGVSWHERDQKYQAAFSFQGKRHFVGLFTSLEAARVAYEAAATRIRGEWHRSA